MADKIKAIKKYGRKAKGRASLLKYLQGEKISKNEAILAKCYDCMGYYADGIGDCGVKDCPLYPFNPYKNTKE